MRTCNVFCHFGISNTHKQFEQHLSFLTQKIPTFGLGSISAAQKPRSDRLKMNFYTFLQDGQDPKVVEKIHDKIADMLTAGEHIEYIAVQKKPVVTLWPDCIAVSDKRIFLCEFTKFGLTTNFEVFRWNEVRDVTFEAGMFGVTMSLVPMSEETLIISHIPEAQARKLHEIIKTELDNVKNPAPAPEIEKTEARHLPPPQTVGKKKQEITFEIVRPAEDDREEPIAEPIPAGGLAFFPPEEPVPKALAIPSTDENDGEQAQKLEKLKKLYHRQLITRAEYESLKSERLSQSATT